MGNTQSQGKIKCFNEINTKFSKLKTNYFCELHECKSGLDSSFIREFPKGCFNYFCEDCYYKYYHNHDINLKSEATIEAKSEATIEAKSEATIEATTISLLIASTVASLFESEFHPKYLDNPQLTKEGYIHYSKMPIFEHDREMVKGPWPKSMRMDKPLWTEIPEGIIVKLNDRRESRRDTKIEDNIK